jgi:hypothetical protein
VFNKNKYKRVKVYKGGKDIFTLKRARAILYVRGGKIVGNLI